MSKEFREALSFIQESETLRVKPTAGNTVILPHGENLNRIMERHPELSMPENPRTIENAPMSEYVLKDLDSNPRYSQKERSDLRAEMDLRLIRESSGNITIVPGMSDEYLKELSKAAVNNPKITSVNTIDKKQLKESLSESPERLRETLAKGLQVDVQLRSYARSEQDALEKAVMAQGGREYFELKQKLEQVKQEQFDLSIADKNNKRNFERFGFLKKSPIIQVPYKIRDLKIGHEIKKTHKEEVKIKKALKKKDVEITSDKNLAKIKTHALQETGLSDKKSREYIRSMGKGELKREVQSVLNTAPSRKKGRGRAR